MKKIYIYLTAFLLTFSANSIYADGFNSIHTIDGINVIAVGNEARIFRTTNSGTNWGSQSSSGPNFMSVCGLGINVWIGGDNGYVYKTAIVYSPLQSTYIGENFSINSIQFTDANTGFLCGNGGRLYKSTNGGTNWNVSNTGISNVKLNSISFKDNLNGAVVGENGVCFITNNGGTSWNKESISTVRNLLDVKFFNDGIVIVGEWGVLFTKPNAGAWSQVNTNIRSDIRGIAGTSMIDVHVCGGGGFIRNNTNGNSLFRNFEINPMLANLVDLIYVGTKGFAVSSLNNAIIRTTNSGAIWVLPSGATVSYNWALKPGASGNFLGNNLSLHPTDRNSVFIVFGTQVYKSNNKGEDWAPVGNPITAGNTPHSFFVSPRDTNIWLVAMAGSSPDKIYRTTNYGQSWTEVLARNFSNYGQPLEMDQNDPRTFYFAPDNGGFYRSTDDGATFTEISNNFAFRSPCDIIVMHDSSKIIFVADGITGSGQAKVFKSVNGGVNWTDVHTAASSEIPSMANTVFDQSLIWATEWSGSTIYRSTNHGNNFSVHHNNTFSGWGSDICHEDPTLMITGSWGASAVISLNAGANWTNISSGLGGHGGGILIPDRGYMLCHQGSNVYKLNVAYSVLTWPLDPTYLAPILLEPQNNITSSPIDIQFRWSKIYSPLFYIFQLTVDSTFSTLLLNDTIPSDTIRIVNGLQGNTKYFWRVISVHPSNQAYYSNVFNFKTVAFPQINLALKSTIEGLYYPLFNQHSRRDTVSVYLRNSTPPFALRDSAKGVIDSLSYLSSFTFNNVNSGRYYIVVKHNQSIETWSRAGGDSLIANGIAQTYDFTTSASQAYGSNMKLKGGKYCIISGDTYQDGFIDGSDLLVIDNDLFNFATGRFLISDLNGDGYTDAADMQIADNNRSREVIRP